MFEIPAALLSWFYGFTTSYAIAIGLMAVVVIAITTPLTLESTKGALEMQRLEPEIRRLQNEYRNDRIKLNEEMMRRYQEHKINPAASFLPLVAQAAVFFIMFRVLRGLIYAPRGPARPIADAVWAVCGRADQVADPGFIPRYVSFDSALYESLFAKREMMSLGIDLSKSAASEIANGIIDAWPYIVLVVVLGALSFVLQRMVAARASTSPKTMSAGQQTLLRYLPVVFAVFQIFFLAALVVYYIVQTLARLVQQAYITRSLVS
jgi:YidC/Oxa1 family membrane protein insertase